MTYHNREPRTRRRPSSRGRYGDLWSAARRIARGNDADYAVWDDEHEDDHLSRRGPVYVTTWETTWRGLRPFVVPASEAWTDSEWGAKLREAAEARRAARMPWGASRMPDAWAR